MIADIALGCRKRAGKMKWNEQGRQKLKRDGCFYCCRCSVFQLNTLGVTRCMQLPHTDRRISWGERIGRVTE